MLHNVFFSFLNNINRYPEARSITRKLIFHAGPTNSGKTHRALERFINAKSGVYCGPLKLLSVEVFNKTNERVSKKCHKIKIIFLYSNYLYFDYGLGIF